MEKTCKMNSDFKNGVIAGIPLVIGYVPIAMTFGILSKNMGISMIDNFLFSALVFAGASQFMALNLLLVGTGMGEIILTTFLVNLRHFLMSSSLATRITEDMKKWTPLIAFGVTDESFSVISFNKEGFSKEYVISLQLMGYFAWVGGTVLGYLVGGILPDDMSNSMAVGLYTMFAAILIPEAKKSKRVVILVCLSGIINTIFKYFQILPQGWSIIGSIVLASFIGLYLFKEEEETHE